MFLVSPRVCIIQKETRDGDSLIRLIRPGEGWTHQPHRIECVPVSAGLNSIVDTTIRFEAIDAFVVFNLSWG